MLLLKQIIAQSRHSVKRFFLTTPDAKNKPLIRIYGAARTSFQRNPLLANSISLGIMYLGAELSQQTLSHYFKRWRWNSTESFTEAPNGRNAAESLHYDLSTAKNFGIVGGVIFGPICRFWYGFLDRKFVGNAGKTVMQKIFFDQTFFAPFCLVVFFAALSYLEGKSDIFEEVREKFLHSFVIDCLFWIPVQATNFLFVSPTFRVLYLGIFCFLWLNILCVIKNIDSYRENPNIEIEAEM